jgi:hypothetical protein
VLLRYLSQLYRTLDQNVPDAAKTEEVLDLLGFFRSMLERVDTSLIEEWEGLRHPELVIEDAEDSHRAHRRLVIEELRNDERKLSSRVRAELRQLVHALSRRAWEDAADAVRQPSEAAEQWPPERFEAAMAPFYERFEALVFDHRARLADTTIIDRVDDRRWRVTQRLVDPEDENLWFIDGEIDLDRWDGGPLIAISGIGG